MSSNSDSRFGIAIGVLFCWLVIFFLMGLPAAVLFLGLVSILKLLAGKEY